MTEHPPEPPSSVVTSAGASRPNRPRYRPMPRRPWQRVPLSVWLSLPVLLAGIAWVGYRSWQQSRAVLQFVVEDPAIAVPALELTLFPEQFGFAQLSPAPALGSLQTDGRGEVAIERELVAHSALVRYAGNGIGSGVARLVRGQPGAPITLRAPTSVRGRVGVPEGFFCFGLRSLGMRAVSGARVLGLWGGDQGIVVSEAVADAEGRFVLAGIDSSLPVLGIRVLAPGFAIRAASYAMGNAGDAVLALLPTLPIQGRVVFPPGVLPDGLRVLAKGLPGVDTAIAADGAFALDHVPPGLQPRLLVHGLAAHWTHVLTHGSPGDRDVVLEVVPAQRVRGRVVNGQTLLPVAHALVWHDHGPLGGATVDADADGAFVLERLPAGTMALRAQGTLEDRLGNRTTLTGVHRLIVERDKGADNIVVRIE